MQFKKVIVEVVDIQGITLARNTRPGRKHLSTDALQGLTIELDIHLAHMKGDVLITAIHVFDQKCQMTDAVHWR